MKRTLLAITLLCAAALALPGRARAQGYTVYFGEPADTALGLIPSGETRIPVRASYLCSTVKASGFTIRYDSTVVTFAGVVPGGLTPVGTSARAGLYSVSDTGTVCGSDVVLFSLRAVLKASTNGAFIWTSVDSLTLSNYTGDQALTERTTIGQLCHATRLFGDIDGDGSIDSRDALIALSAAVGLPIPNGYNLVLGDVDRSGTVNSRDALLMLSWAIGLPITNVNVQLGEAAPDACPGTSPPGEFVVFKRNGSGIWLLTPTGTASLIGGTVPGDSAPRLSPDSVTVLYACQDSAYSYYQRLCVIGTNGAGRRHLTPASYYTLPDLSPNRTRTLFQYGSGGALYWGTMSDTGATPAYYPPGSTCPLYAYGASWSRDGSRIAYTSGGFNLLVNSVCTTPAQARGLWKADTSTTPTLPPTFVQLDTAYTAYYVSPRWSPKGDSVAYVRGADNRIWVVSSAGGSAAVPYTNFAGTISGFDWGPQGLLFSLDTGNHHPSLWLLPSQNAPIVRITGPATGDWQPSFRRNP